MQSGIDGCIFIHASGFIGGNQTKAGAIQMAIKALEMDLEQRDREIELVTSQLDTAVVQCCYICIKI